MYTYEDTAVVCASNISFWFRGDNEITEEIKVMMKEEAIDRAKHDLNNEYLSGELCFESESEEPQQYNSYTGWWKRNKDI
jgi:hypothetical protein